jgi:hypothetical protein
MGEMIRVVVARPKAAAEVVEIDGSLASLQKLVGGHIEFFVYFEPLRQAGLHVYVNEDGRALALERSAVFGGGPLEDVLGPIVVSKAGGEGEEVGLSESEATFAVAFLNRLRLSQGLLAVQSRKDLASTLRPVRAEHASHAQPVDGCPFCEGAIT